MKPGTKPMLKLLMARGMSVYKPSNRNYPKWLTWGGEFVLWNR